MGDGDGAGAVSDPLAELVTRAQRGDRGAFARLVTETQDNVYNLAYRVLGQPQEAQDAAQDALVRAWRALPQFRGQSKFATWLYRITVNTCLNRRRSLRPQLQQVDADDALGLVADPDADPQASAVAREQAEVVWAAVEQLPEKYRLVITLFYQQELSYQEIAELLSLPLGTVKAHLNRARQALARQLRPAEEADDVDVR